MLLSLLFFGCGDKGSPELEPIYLQEGSPVAGVSEGRIDAPVGTPLGGYSSRCDYIGGAGSVDRRQSQYTVAFNPSAGVQTTAMAQVLWLENGDQHIVMINIDSIYIYDEMVEEIERVLEADTGIELDGRIILTASHTHQAPANFSDQIHFYLGGDRYNQEVYQRYTDSLVALALEAYENREPAAIGFGEAKDWDPDDKVYVDRRSENDDLILWDDFSGGKYKDPYLWMLRVDSAADNSPLGVFFNFGIHGTSLNDDNALISTDAPGHIEVRFQEKFDSPIVVSHFQGGGGDISPAGDSMHGHEYARMEGIGEFAVDALYELWDSIETSTNPFTLETVTRSISQSHTEIQVTRNGTVDWRYRPYERDYVPDDQIFDENGEILTPLDEFNTKYGAVFCGYDDPLVSTGTIGSSVYPYDGCMKIELILDVVNGVFKLNEFFEDGLPLPMPSSLKANTTTTRMGPVSIRKDDGSIVQEDIVMGFFPGETTSYYVHHYRDRVISELGFTNVIVGGYAQDHEGYLLIPEDWLQGGYEANINVWGPLQGEHIMEGNLDMSHHITTDILEPHDPKGMYRTTKYLDRPLPELQPDVTLTAGTAASFVIEDMYIPLNTEIQIEPQAELPRVQGLAQFLWEGGDPAVDYPTVVLEYYYDGEWFEVTTPSGRAVTEQLPDILLSHTPDPLYPYYDDQNHYWWVGWQIIGIEGERTALPLGTYRFHIYGKRFSGSETTWPWSTTDYEITAPEFNVVPANLELTNNENGLYVSIPGPDWGYRLIDVLGSSNGDNPPVGLSLQYEKVDGTFEDLPCEESVENSRVLCQEIEIPSEAIKIIATDISGNTGSLELE
jgi:neutral ceramidase